MSEQPPKSTGGLGGLLGQVFAYVDRPWKAVVVATLGVLGLAAWVVYDKREILLEHWLTPSAVALKSDDVPAALEKLVSATGADLIQIWEVDLGANVQRFIAARRKDGQRAVIPEPRRLPVITSRSDIRVLVEVLGGHPSCGVINDKSHSPVIERLVDRGMTRACAIPIPPGPEAFIGIIYMSWINPPEATAEDVAVQAAREVAGNLATR